MSNNLGASRQAAKKSIVQFWNASRIAREGLRSIPCRLGFFAALLLFLCLGAVNGQSQTLNTLSTSFQYVPPLTTIPAPAPGGNVWYVDGVNGSDSNDGLSRATAFKTIARVYLPWLNTAFRGGDVVVILPATYTENIRLCDNSASACWPAPSANMGGTPGNYTTFMGMPCNGVPPGQGTCPRPVLLGGQPGSVELSNAVIQLKAALAYVRISGLEITASTPAAPDNGATGHAQPNACISTIGPATYVDAGGATRPRIHHLVIDNNVAHDCSLGGISLSTSDYVIIQGNTVYNNANWSNADNSGIGISQMVDYDNGTGYHAEIIDNIAYNNLVKVPAKYNCSPSATKCSVNGNGITVDRQTSYPNYAGSTVVLGNLVFNNGGRGINVGSHNNVDIINNTSYYNGQPNAYTYQQSSTNPEVLISNSAGIKPANVGVYNNILVPSNYPSEQSGFVYNPTFAYSSLQPFLQIHSATNVAISYNLASNSDYLVGGVNTNVPLTLDSTNILGVDPQFVNATTDPSAANFQLLSSSPALAAGGALPFDVYDLTGSPFYADPAQNFNGAANPSIGANIAYGPTLLLNPARLATLRNEIQSAPKQAMWQRVKAAADALVQSGPPAYTTSGSNDAQLWQRPVGDNMGFLAMAYLLETDPTAKETYRQAAQTWALASCNYPHWGTGGFDGNDLSVGHQLYGLAIIYDWVNLDPTVRATIRQTILTRGGYLYTQASTHKTYWDREVLQNHLWIPLAGLTASAFALEHNPATGAADTPAVQPWIDYSLAQFQATDAALPADGASHEGAGYWEYGADFMPRFWALAQDFLGKSPTSAWWQNTAGYRLYLSTPKQAWGSYNANAFSRMVDIADCLRWDWTGDYPLHWLAARNNDGVAQDLSNSLTAEYVAEHHYLENLQASWLGLIWYDLSVAPVSPATAGLPTMKHFDDLGIVSSRTDWSGNESLVVFKAGPPLGHSPTLKGLDANGLNIGHAHPDANHFVIFGAGEWLVKDDGYAWKMTSQHNTLLVDGGGQSGEGLTWLANNNDNSNDYNGKTGGGSVKIIPWDDTVENQIRIVSASSSPTLDYAIGDATAAYPTPFSGVQKFVRYLVFLKPDTVVVVDDIQMDKTRALELRLHPQYAFGAQAGDGSWTAQGTTSLLRFQDLTPSGVTQTFDASAMARYTDGNYTIPLPTMKLQTSAQSWQHAMALSWSANTGTPPTVTMTTNASKWTFHVGSRSATVDLTAGTVQQP